MIDSLYDLLDNDKLDIYLNNNKYNNPYTKQIIKQIISTDLTITKLKKYLYIMALEDWNQYKNEHKYLFFNNYNKTIEQLKMNDNLIIVTSNLPYFNDIKLVLGKTKYDKFYNSLSNLHYLIHNNIFPEYIIQYQKEVSRYLSLYNAINKEKYINNIVNNYLEQLRPFYKLKTDDNIIYRKIYEKKQRQELQNLYNKNNHKIIHELEKIKKKYSNYAKKLNITEEQLNIIIDKYVKLIVDISVKRPEEIISKTESNNLLLCYIFSKLRRDIIKYAKTLNIELSPEDLIYNNGELKDEYYEFDINTLKQIPIESINEYVKRINKINKHNKQLFIDDGLLLFSLIIDRIKPESIFNKQNTLDIIDNYKDISMLTKKINNNSLLYITNFNKMLKKRLINIAILGYDILKKVHDSNTYTYESFDKKVKVLCDLASTMYKRQTSTIPYISGYYQDYKYTIYDNNEYDVLTSGIDTNSCFKATGTENDFFHYTILSKNGINIKILDNDNQPIARVSGHRYGNGIYLNQLRAINDSYYDEQKLKETLKKICDDLINKSTEDEKIEFVIITKSQIMENEKSNIPKELADYIAINSIDNKSEDWLEFTKCKNLDESYYGAFINDYGTVDLICVSSVVGKLTKDKIKLYSPKDKYKRKRSRIIFESGNNKVEKQINRIRAIYCYKNNITYKYQSLYPNQKIIMGDNWYIIYNNQIIDKCCLIEDEKAYIEYISALNYVNEILQEKIIKIK